MVSHLNEALYGTKRSAIREFSRLARSTPGCVALTLGEPDFDSPVSAVESACESLRNGETHYIDNGGIYALRHRIAEFEREKNGMDYTPEEIIVTAGASEAIFVSLFGILNPGDEVIVPVPAFLLYEELIRLCRGVPVFLDTTEDGFQINREKLNSLITSKTKAVVLNTPNNPTGCVYSRESLQAVHDAVSGKPIFVLCDDVYRQLIYTDSCESFSSFRDLREQLLVVQSFSKPYAMTGWRMGYLMADGAIMERLSLVHQYAVTSTPAPFQKAAIAALDYDPQAMVDTYRRRRDMVLGRLDRMRLPYTVPEGAFYVFPSVQPFGLSSREFCLRMIREAGLAATPGSCFGTEGNIRLTYCYSEENLREGLDRLENFIQKL